MSVFSRIYWAGSCDGRRLPILARGLDIIFDTALRSAIVRLIDDVGERGDIAVCEALDRFDGVSVSPEGLRISDDEVESAKISTELEQAIDTAIANVRIFNEQQLERLADWSHEVAPGLVFGEKVTPISSAGFFTPSGKASYPGGAYQLAVPALVACVPEIAMVVPPVPGGSGEVDPAVLVVCRKLGIRNVFRVNGPAGIAALGFGTETIPKVRKVVGPGSPAVTIAQVEMQRHGVATMMILGPTESLVIADDTADVMRLAADLLIEAEHGTDSAVVLVTPSAALVNAVDAELELQLADLPEARASAARASLGVNGGAVIVNDLDAAIDFSNRYAPEHLQVAVADSEVGRVVDSIVNAGEILIGQHTPFSAANFVIGCPASLPTSGFAHVSSGITAQAFMKRTALARADERALADMAPAITALADHEGFQAHAAAIRRRHPTG